MDDDEKIVYCKRPTCKQRHKYFSKLLESTIITGVPQIVTEKNIKRKLFKIVVLLSCLGGFCHQVFSFLSLYFLYPTSLEVLVQFRDTEDLPKPMVTICGINGIRRTAYCRENRRDCHYPENRTRVCLKNPHFCEKQNFTDDDMLFPAQDIYRYADYNRDVVEKYGTRFEDILTPNYRDITSDLIYLNEMMKLRRCYAVEVQDITKLSNKSDSLYSSLRLHGSGINTIADLVVSTQPEESFRPAVPVGNKVSIHSKDEMINPFIKGFLVSPGYRYLIRLKVIEHDLLTSPYTTNCTHYAKWNEGDFAEIYTYDMCVNMCKKKYWLQVCGCVSPAYPLNFTERSCSNASEFNCVSNFDVDDCYTDCNTPCRTTVFESEVVKVPIETILEDENITLSGYDETYHLRRRTSVLNFFFERPEIFIYKYNPKFKPIELFGYLGGYIGIWLGMSLIAVFDLLEIIVVYLYHVARGEVPLKP